MKKISKYLFQHTLLLVILFSISATQASSQSVNSLDEAVVSDNSGDAITADSDAEARPEVLIVGGGSSHNFERWFNLEDSRILADAGANVRYTDDPEYIKELLPELDILYLSNNQSLPDPELRKAIFDFVESGNDLLLVHAAIWYNWSDWPEYNKDLVGGGSRGHDDFGEFEVQVVNDDHPIMENISSSFKITDELYRYEKDESGSEIEVLAKGIEPATGDEFPVVWTVDYGEGQIVCTTLGHDDQAHEHDAYINILKNSLNWLQEN
jgi:type 1 glutamine amidotransferase